MLNVMVVCPDYELRESLCEAVDGMVEILRTVEAYPPPVEFLRMLRAHAPEAILLSTESLREALALAIEAERNYPGLQIVAVGRTCDNHVLLECMRAGIREFATAPFDRNMLEECFLHVLSGLQARPVKSMATEKVFCFMPVKGGVGATTVAMNVAAALAKDAAGTVALADFDLAGGILRFLLKLHNANSTIDAIDRAVSLDENFWPQLVTRVGGVDVLHSGATNPSAQPEAAHIRRLLEFMRRNYDSICLDISGRCDVLALEAMAEAKRIVMVCTPEAPALHMAREKLDYLEQVQLASRCVVVLNRCTKRPVLTLNEVERILGVPVFASLPNDYQSVQRALNDGTWLPHGSEIAKGIQNLADLLVEKQAPVKETKKSLVGHFAIRSSRFGVIADARRPAVG